MSAIILDCNENIVITISEVLAAPPPPRSRGLLQVLLLLLRGT